jgi:hypothetical protein
MICFFGMLGTNNDIIVLDSSHVLHNYLSSEAKDLSFNMNGLLSKLLFANKFNLLNLEYFYPNYNSIIR